MLVKAQKYEGGRIIVVDSCHVSAWEISDQGTLFADLDTGECLRMGQFPKQEDALRFLSRMQLHANNGTSVMGVPDQESKNED